MDLHYLFLSLAAIIFVGRVLGDLFNKFGIPAVLGEIFAGIVLGTSVLGLIEVNDAIKVLAEIGIILLLFKVGLEADIHQLKKVGIPAFIVATVGAALPMLFGSLLSYYLFNLPLTTSLFIGGTLTATSIGITVKVLTDLGKMNQRFAQIVLAAAVLDDIFGVIVLAVLYEFAKKGTVDITSTITMIFYIATFFVLAPVLAKVFAKLINVFAIKLKSEDFIPVAVMSLIFLFAFLSHEVGSPEILGAFTVGLALSRRFVIPFAVFLKIEEKEKMVEKVEHSINPLVSILTPIFFVSIGLSLNLKAIDFTSLDFWKISIVLLIVAILGKVLSGFFVKGTSKEKLLIGFSMLPRGEVGLIFAELGKQAKLFDDLLYAVIIFVVAFTTLISPIILKILVKG
ncbi:cation:proton antiporter [Sulfurihydrogenibium azorense]|jgi:Kef-type K+ transport system membrane component KefB|uniref:Na+:H+ antiporter, NhaA family n=1 Tax=Sulfurihydrogenibium azorense (strain DSM 15241 / OCM 825 / Az-Fu1) TaxID=204536 RepID=C1DVT6_SULAA|nr:cation:proton antiporter [Sulfurihydrogenibium azorense]ACN99019.1 Na+:H+ antiporter, NhaA family [Sulfurihydrogenibium azorense Az-Fu1]MDM7273571.1 cation:proton antiporter [Sulfurihydrogenibium azorense]